MAKFSLTTILPLLLPLVWLTGDEPSKKGDEPATEVREEAEQALRNRDFSRALNLLDRLDTEADLRLAVRAAALGEMWPETLARAKRYLERYPEAIEAGEVRFHAAKAHWHSNDWEQAAAAVGAQLERLDGDDFREFVSAELLRRADEAFEGVMVGEGAFARRTTPDFAEATRLYGAALHVGVPQPVTFRVQMRWLQGRLQLHHFSQVIHRVDALQRDGSWTEEENASLATVKTRALIRYGEFWKAELAWQQLRHARPQWQALPSLLGEMAQTAEEKQYHDVADRARHRLIRDYPNRDLAVRAAYARADAAAELKDLRAALPLYREALQSYPDAEQAPAARMSIARGMVSLGRFDEAAAEYAGFLERHRQSPLWTLAAREHRELRYEQGQALLQVGQLAEAEIAFERYLSESPSSGHAPAILIQLGQAHQASGAAAEAFRRFSELLQRFPDAEQAPLAQWQLGQLFEQELGDPDRAVAEYRAVVEAGRDTNVTRQARRRLAHMQATDMELRTPRIYTTDEAVRVQLQTRNIEQVRWSAYRLDVAAYFARHGSLDGVEDIMTAVIAPDWRSEDQFADYAPYRDQSHELELKLPAGPGAFLLTCEGGDLRATTLILRSDLMLITKDGTQEVLALVLEANEHAPVAGVRVLLAEDDGPSREARTGKDGVARLERKHEQSSAAVLAIGEKGVAVSEIYRTESRARGVATRIHLSSDRSLYRPGDEVGVRAIVRAASADGLVTPVGQEIRLLSQDPFGNSLLNVKLELSEFGTAAAKFRLPQELPDGQQTYKIVARFGDYDETLTIPVRPYHKPELFLELASGVSPIIAGEEIHLQVEARQLFDQAVPDLPVQVRVHVRPRVRGSQRQLVYDETQVTNAEGRIEFTLPAHPALREANQDQDLMVQAWTEDWSGRFVSTRAKLRVAYTDFVATLRGTQWLHRPGQEVRLRLATSDPRGEPVARQGELALLWLGESSDAGVEQQLWTRSWGTEAAGIQEESLRLPERDGYYRFEWQGRDRRGRWVRATDRFHIERESPLEIQLIADRSEFEVGEEGQLEILAPNDLRTLWLSFEGENVRDYRVLRMESGRSTVPIRFEQEDLPNLWIRAAGPAREQGSLVLATGSESIKIRQQMVLELEPDDEEVRPGQTGKLRVSIRDGRGRPIQAEFALAVVDEALYRLEADRTLDLAKSLLPPERRNQVSTHSSLEWSFDGYMEELAPELIEERERRKRESSDLAANLPVLIEAEALDPHDEVIEELDFEEESFESSVGIGGGAGGAFGGRAGARGSGRRVPDRTELVRAPDFDSDLREDFRDTAIYLAQLETNAEGEAIVVIPYPDQLTTWRITVRAVGRGNLGSEARTRVVTRKPLMARVAAPNFLRQGDLGSGRVMVINRCDQPVTARLHLSHESDSAESGTTDIRESLSLSAGATWSQDFPLPVGGVESLRLDAELNEDSDSPTETEHDALRHEVPVLPSGVRLREGRAGRLRHAREIEVDWPQGFDSRTARLELHLYPSLVDGLQDQLEQLERFPFGCVEQTVHRIWPALVAERLLELPAIRQREYHERLRVRVRQAIQRLSALQGAEGSWGWWSGTPSAEMTAYALIGLAEARRSRYSVSDEVWNKAGLAAKKLLVRQTDEPDEAAFLAFALVRAKMLDWPMLAPIYRERESLGVRGLALLALCCDELDITQSRESLLDELRRRMRRDGADPEATGYALLALLRSHSPEAAQDKLLDTLLAQLRETDRGNTRVGGTTALVLAHWIARQGDSSAKGEVDVQWNGQSVARLSLRPGSITRWQLPQSHSSTITEQNRLRLVPSGGALPLYSLNWSHRAPSPMARQASHSAARIERLYRYFRPSRAGLKAQSWKDEIVRARMESTADLGSVSPGELVLVSLQLEFAEAGRYWMVADPLPAGFERLGEPEGGYSAWEQQEDRIVFFLERPKRGKVLLRYTLRAVWPGQYACPPAELSPMYRPWQQSFSSPTALRIDAGEAASGRDPTEGVAPDLALEKARAAWQHGEAERAQRFARALLDGPRLTDEAAWEVHLILARTAWPDDAESVVEHYTQALNLDPLGALKLEDREKLARARFRSGLWQAAYADLIDVVHERYARDRSVYKALADEDYDRDRFLYKLSRAYPQESAVEADRIRLARSRITDTQIKARVPHQRKEALKGLDQVRLTLAEFPLSPTAPEIDRLLQRGLRSCQAYSELAREAEQFAQRFPDHAYLDGADFDRATALFAQGRYRQAIDAAERYRGRGYRDVDGEASESDYALNLIHLQAQAHHALGELDRAESLYREVAEFSDEARLALEELTHSELRVPEHVQVASGEVLELEVRGRRLGSVTVKVYAIDLLAYLSLSKELDDLRTTKLDGLPPARQWELAPTEEVGTGLWTRTLSLEGLEQGVFLAVVQAKDHQASCVLVKTDLVIQPTPNQFGLRGQLLQRGTGEPVAGAYVKLAGDGEILGSVRTDARGIFELESGGVAAAIVAEHGGQFAFWLQPR